MCHPVTILALGDSERAIWSPVDAFGHSGDAIRSPVRAFGHSERAIWSPFWPWETLKMPSGHLLRHSDTPNVQSGHLLGHSDTPEMVSYPLKVPSETPGMVSYIILGSSRASLSLFSTPAMSARAGKGCFHFIAHTNRDLCIRPSEYRYQYWVVAQHHFR